MTTIIECKSCGGTGRAVAPSGYRYRCPACDGYGRHSTSDLARELARRQPKGGTK